MYTEKETWGKGNPTELSPAQTGIATCQQLPLVTRTFFPFASCVRYLTSLCEGSFWTRAIGRLPASQLFALAYYGTPKQAPVTK